MKEVAPFYCENYKNFYKDFEKYKEKLTDLSPLGLVSLEFATLTS